MGEDEGRVIDVCQTDPSYVWIEVGYAECEVAHSTADVDERVERPLEVSVLFQGCEEKLAINCRRPCEQRLGPDNARSTFAIRSQSISR